MFLNHHTRLGVNGELSDTKRAFFMRNALVVGVVDRIVRKLNGQSVAELIRYNVHPTV